jgi:hypothetical protein
MGFVFKECPECEGSGELSRYSKGGYGDPQCLEPYRCPYCEDGEVTVYEPDADPNPITARVVALAAVGYALVIGMLLAIIYGEQIRAFVWGCT